MHSEGDGNMKHDKPLVLRMHLLDQEALKLSIVCMRTGFTQALANPPTKTEKMVVIADFAFISFIYFVWSCLALHRDRMWLRVSRIFESAWQYLDKDELLTIAGGSKNWPVTKSNQTSKTCQVFNTLGDASRIRALPAFSEFIGCRGL